MLVKQLLVGQPVKSALNTADVGQPIDVGQPAIYNRERIYQLDLFFNLYLLIFVFYI